MKDLDAPLEQNNELEYELQEKQEELAKLISQYKELKAKVSKDTIKKIVSSKC